MGRYYYGQISGKFWFGIQSSYDAENLGGKMSSKEEYMCCGCSCEGGSPNFCDSCYETLEAHLEDAKNDDFEITEPFTLKHESNFVEYYFGEEQLKEVEDHFTELGDKIGHLVKGLEVGTDEDRFEYDMDWEYPPFKDATKEEQILVARYCLAKQIIECIVVNGQCCFDCEQ